MSATLNPGARLRSAVCAAEVIVIRTDGEVDLRCGGIPMVDRSTETGPAAEAPIPPHDTGTNVGKRYADAELGLEVLCTKSGAGSLAVGEKALPEKSAKPLPASD